LSAREPVELGCNFKSRSSTTTAAARGCGYESGTKRSVDYSQQIRRLDRLDVIVRPEEMDVPGFDFQLLFRSASLTAHVGTF
jgi:hypothetical protein